MPLISVIVPTFNRAALLESSLESLTQQSLPGNQYEVIVVDDGSTDASSETCHGFLPTMDLKYFRIEHSGISSAKNIGVFVSSSPILLFFDDDDIADIRLLEEHLKLHRENPQESVVVLGYTTWRPGLEVTPMMEYVTQIGQWLTAYQSLRDGQILDFTYFWGGRSSCKRSFLVRHGVFDQRFQSILEDIELGYRLSKFGLKVVFHRNAVSYMAQPTTYEEFCHRCEREGKAQFLFSQLHPNPVVRHYCQVGKAEARWQDLKQSLQGKVRRVREIEALLTSQIGAEERNILREELRSLYEWTFEAFRAKGIMDAKESGGDLLPQRIHDLIEVGDASERRVTELRRRWREMVRNTLPPDATVVVVDGGDDELPELEDRQTWRFPQAGDDGPGKLFAEGSEGTEEASWIWPNMTYDFRLYAGKEHNTRLATVEVRRGSDEARSDVASADSNPHSDEAYIVASPNPVEQLGFAPGTTNISWSTGDGSWGQVYVSQKRTNAYYPADSEEAIAQLEALREKGAEFLLFPGTAFWWLEHYRGLRRHLESRYRMVAHQEDICFIFDLREPRLLNISEPTDIYPM